MSVGGAGLAALLAIPALGLVSSGCVAQSTAQDLGAVRGLVRDRATLELPVRESQSPEELDPDVGTLAARPLTLESAVRIALLNNRDLRAELRSLGVPRGQLVQASLFPNPNFEAEMRVSQDPTQGPQWDLGVGVGLTDVILRGKRKGVAQAELEAARFRAAGATLDTVFRVRLAYYEVQARQQELALARAALEAYAASYDTAKVLQEAGNLTDLDLATEQSAYEGARVAVAEAEARQIEARERLNVLLGLFGHTSTWQLAGPLPDPAPSLGQLARLESRAIEASLELAETRATLVAAARRVGLTQTAGWLPELNLGLHAEHDGTYWEVGPALGGRLPLFDRQQGNVLSRQAELDALRERYVGDAIAIRAATRAARARALSAQERALHYRDTILPLRQRVTAETVVQYNAMQLGVFQVLQARRDQLEASRAYVATLHEYWQARATLEQLLAGRLAGTLPSATEASPHTAQAQSIQAQATQGAHGP